MRIITAIFFIFSIASSLVGLADNLINYRIANNNDRSVSNRPIIVIVINPLDCPTCFLGYKKIKEDIFPHFFKKIYFILPADAKTAASKIFKDRLNEDFNEFSNFTIFNDSIYHTSLYKGLSTINILHNDSIVWQQSIREFYIQKSKDYKPILIDQFELPDTVFNKSSAYEILNDSLFCINDPLMGQLTIRDPLNMSRLYTLSNEDTSLIKFLYRSIENTFIKEFNLKFVNTPEPLSEKYGFNPLNFLNLKYENDELWISAKLLVVEQKDSNLIFYPNSFLFKTNNTLNKIHAYALPYCFKNSNVCPYPAYFHFYANNKLVIPNATGSNDSLFSTFTVSDSKLIFNSVIPFKLPTDLPKKGTQGYPIFYSPVLYSSTGMACGIIYNNSTVYNLFSPNSSYKLYKIDSLTKLGHRIVAAAVNNKTLIIATINNEKIHFHFFDENYNYITTHNTTHTLVFTCKYHPHLNVFSFVNKSNGFYKLNVIKFL